MRRMLIALAIVAAGCTPGASTVTETPTTVEAPALAAPPPASAAPTTVPTTARPTSTTAPTTTTTTTTTTTLPPIDRSTEASGARMVDDVATLVGFGPRVEGSPEEAAAGQWIEQQLAAITGDAGVVETMQVSLPDDLASRTYWVTFGDTGTGEWTLLGGHYDTITGSPGADDNASGTAVLIELARRLSEHPPESGAITIALFGAEEIYPGLDRTQHHYGSRQWVAARTDSGAPLPGLMVSVDMVGVGDRLYAVAYSGTSVLAVDLLDDAGTAAGITVGRLEKGDISDHEPFALAGVPAAMLWRPDNPNYHGPGDVAVNETHLVDNLTLLEHLIATIYGG